MLISKIRVKAFGLYFCFLRLLATCRSSLCVLLFNNRFAYPCRSVSIRGCKRILFARLHPAGFEWPVFWDNKILHDLLALTASLGMMRPFFDIKPCRHCTWQGRGQEAVRSHLSPSSFYAFFVFSCSLASWRFIFCAHPWLTLNPPSQAGDRQKLFFGKEKVKF